MYYKASAIAKENNLPVKEYVRFVEENYPVKYLGITNAVGVDESIFSETVTKFREHYAPIEAGRTRIIRELEEEEARKEELVRTMPITSGHGFEGYRIVRYGGYVSGDEAIMLSDTWFGSGFSKDAINNAIKAIRVTAIEELKVAAAEIGCNAVIGLDFDYVTVDRQRNGLSGVLINETYLILTANGTAVTIVPNEL